jgi:hypothetical protein
MRDALLEQAVMIARRRERDDFKAVGVDGPRHPAC